MPRPFTLSLSQLQSLNMNSRLSPIGNSENLGKSWPGREAEGGGSLSIFHCPLPSGPRIQDLQLLIGLAVKSSPFFFHSALFSSSLLQTSDCFFLSVGALPDPLWLSPTRSCLPGCAPHHLACLGLPVLSSQVTHALEHECMCPNLCCDPK